MKLEELLQGVQVVDMNAPAQTEITSLTDSSLEACAGGMFIAVRGYATDGHRYIPNAVEAGAGVIVCEDEMPQNAPWVRVKNARSAMAKIASNFYGTPKVKLIGVTGTNGKTSVTFLLKNVIERVLGTKVGLIGTICNMIGQETLESANTTPGILALHRLLDKMHEAGCTHVVMEVSSHALAQERVGEIPFAVGAFTNLTEDHLDFHGTMEEYARAKSLLFRQCEKSVFNVDDPYSARMMAQAKDHITVGENGDICAKNVVLASDHIEMQVCGRSFTHEVNVGIPGRFTVSNSLVVFAMALQLGLAPEPIAKALSQAKGVRGRIEVIPTPNQDFTVLIDYAHTPDGMENILRSVRDYARGRVIIVFGCGGDRDRKKRPMMGEIAARLADVVIVTSDNPRTEEPMSIIRDILEGMKNKKTPYIVEENRRKAIRTALRLAQKNDMILLAGKGHETYQILGREKTHLDEREEVASALCEMQE